MRQLCFYVGRNINFTCLEQFLESSETEMLVIHISFKGRSDMQLNKKKHFFFLTKSKERN